MPNQKNIISEREIWNTPFSIRIPIASFPGVTRRNRRAMIRNHAVQMNRQNAKNAKGQNLSQIHTVSLKEARSQNDSPLKSLLSRIRRGHRCAMPLPTSAVGLKTVQGLSSSSWQLWDR